MNEWDFFCTHVLKSILVHFKFKENKNIPVYFWDILFYNIYIPRNHLFDFWETLSLKTNN